MDLLQLRTNWNVITGGPCTGKTTVVNLLAERGYTTTVEHARHYIDTQKIQGRTVEEIRRNKKDFQLKVLKMQIAQEAALNPEDKVFMDRALPDALAYHRFLGLACEEFLLEQCSKYRYQRIFILERLPLTNDYARLEDESEQIRIHNLICEVYAELGYHAVHVPVLPPYERVHFILKNSQNQEVYPAITP